MVLITASCIVLGASLVLPPLMTFALLLLVLAITAHVAGNFYGTKLRDQATELIRAQREEKAVEVNVDPLKHLPRSRLTDRSPVGIALAVFILVGIVAGVAAGSYAMSAFQTGPVAWPDFLMASVAFAVLGAFWGFLLGGFICIGYRAAKQAIDQSNRPDDEE